MLDAPRMIDRDPPRPGCFGRRCAYAFAVACLALGCSDANSGAKGTSKPSAVLAVSKEPAQRDSCLDVLPGSLLTKCAREVLTDTSNVLSIRLLGGGFAKCEGNGVELACRYRGRIGGYDGKPALHVVEALSEGEAPLLRVINATTGKEVSMHGNLFMSPDGTRFATVAQSAMEVNEEGTCLGPSTLAVWRLSDSLPVNEYTVESLRCHTEKGDSRRLPPFSSDQGWGPAAPTWRSNDTISFVRVALPSDSARRARGVRDSTRALLVHLPAGWALDEKSAALLPGR